MDNLDWKERVCIQVLDEWERGRQHVSDMDDMFDDLYSMIRGERPKKDYDFQSNLAINKVFQIVWTAVPYLAQKIFGANPIMGVTSFDKKGAWQREQILEFWHTLQGVKNSNHIPYFLIVVSLLIRVSLNGSGFLKKTWHQKLKTKTQDVEIKVPVGMGEDGPIIESHTIKKKVSVPIEDWPHNVVIGNKDIVFDWLLSPEQSIKQGRFVIHRAVTDLGALYEDGLYERLDEINAEQSSENSEKNQDHSPATSKDGLDTTPKSDLYSDIEIYERVGLWNVTKKDDEWRPVFEKGKYEDKDVSTKYMVVTVARGGTDTKDVLIRFEPSEYEEINYIDAKCYLDIERWLSVGMVEPAKDTISGQNDVFNGIFDEMWKNLMPPVIVNKHALWDWDTMVHAPHQRWLVGGDPMNSAYFVPGSNVTRDAWQTYGLLDNETQQTSITNSMAGAGKEKTATTNVMNAQLSASKLDFVLKMFETTLLIPSAQMDIRFAKKFAHKDTLNLIVAVAAATQGKPQIPFKFSDWEEIYQYVPAAASVKVDLLKERETTEDIQLLQLLGSVNNPKTAKIMNKILGNIFRNRNMPVEAELLDEEYFEPQSEAGSIQQIVKTMGGPSNQHGIEMTGKEKSVRKQIGA